MIELVILFEACRPALAIRSYVLRLRQSFLHLHKGVRTLCATRQTILSASCFIMNETVRTLTLRKKGGRKPNISAPKQISAPTKASGGKELTVPQQRPGQSETSDIVKRRYSTRFNQLPDFSSGAPAVPGLPGNLKRSSHGGSPSRPARPGSAHAHALQVDVNALADPSLHPERCTNHPIFLRISFDIAAQM
jgi:hypothetical protein